jgi:protein-tyrosine-phosphatase/tRNA A37 threonylcarbamoyladenosine synthetase subunit TsaC/SUA5/YrdC
MVRLLDWKRSEDTRDIVHVVVQALVEGGLVLVPSETTYLLLGSGLCAQAIARMMIFPGRSPQSRPSLLLRSSDEVNDYSPHISRVGRRIAGRGWPGPLALELEANGGHSLCGRLPKPVQKQLLVEERWLSMQVPAHQAIAETLQLLPGPVIATPINDSTGSPLTEAQISSEQQAVDQLVYLVDDGPTHFGGLHTTLRVDGRDCSSVSPGVLDQSVLVGLGQLVILLVCTGNTCRSPMAETLLRAQLGERFKDRKDLFGPGLPPPVVAISAGLSAYPGGAASPEAISAMHSRGLSLKDHQSRPVTQRLLKQADLILTMTASHRHAIVQRWPEAAAKTFMLSNNGQDVADPFGGPAQVYAASAEEIERLLKPWVSWVDESWLPHWKV